MSTSRRRPFKVGRLTLALILLIAPLLLMAPPAVGVDVDPELSVRLDALSPTVLKPGTDITIQGTVSNRNSFSWENVQAYLVIPRSPFTSRAQIDVATTNTDSYTGERIVAADTFDSIGDIEADGSGDFTVEVPFEELGVTGADGVYPVGIQILATDPDGFRSNTSLARATTFLPMLSDPPDDQIPTSVAWPFLMPTYRTADGSYAGAGSLLDAVGKGGRLRNLLDLASSTPADTGTVIVDPALLVALGELADGERLGEDVKASESERRAAAEFVADLVDFSRRDPCWVVEYDRPDNTALAMEDELAKPIQAALDDATGNALDAFGLSCRGVSWPRADTASAAGVDAVRGPGDQPVIVAASNLGGWDRRDGSLVKYNAESGPVPLLVDDALDDQVPGSDSVVGLRQRIASESALAVLQRTFDPASDADAVAVVNPAWNPGTEWREGRLNDAFAPAWIDASGLDGLLTQRIGTFNGTIQPSDDQPLSRAQLQAAVELDTRATMLASVLVEPDLAEITDAQNVAQAASSRWRDEPARGLDIVRSEVQRVDRALDQITIEGPPRVTLSSTSGGFPLTISNDTAQEVSVGVRVDSSNPALLIPPVDPVEIAADERVTLTVNVDVGDQGGASLTASLVTPDNQAFGQPAVFNVRSSTLGTVLWVGFAIAGLLIAAAITRRFIIARRPTLVSDE